MRKRVETEQWLPKWRGRLSDPRALLDLMRMLHRRGCITIEDFRRFKLQAGHYDE